MSNEKMLSSMMALERYEETAKSYYEKYGSYLEFPQFLMLYQNQSTLFTPEQLITPEARAQQERIRRQFSETYGSNLSEEYFLDSSRDIEMEPLLRYIDIPAHQHDFVECVFVLQGYCDHQVGTQTYRHHAGTCSVIVAGMPHHLTPSPDCICLTIKIRNHAFRNLDLPNFAHFVYPISFNTGDDSFIVDILLTMYAQQKEELPYSERIILLLFQAVMVHICQHYWDTLQHLAPHTMRSAQMLEITNFIFENYQTVTLNTLAAHFHFNPSYLSTLIKQQTGIPFSVILKDIRLKHAVHLLTQTNMSVNQICTEIGYQDVSQFISTFRAVYQLTPTQYRRQYSNDTL